VDTLSTDVWWISGGLARKLERGGQVPGQQIANAVDVKTQYPLSPERDA
jgi:hypothetical protein